MSSPTLCIVPSPVLTPTTRQSLSPPMNLPRPPRCLTPYPAEIQFSPKSSSPLSTPSISPNDLPMINLSPDPFDGTQSILTHTPSPIAPRRGIPIELRMSSLSPTDSSFPNIPPTLLSPSINRAWTRAAMSGKIPMSPSAKKYMEQELPRKPRPDPIQVPGLRLTPVSRSATTARPKGRVRIQTPTAHITPKGGSVPLPKTPRVDVETPGRTAMPLTSRRIGSVNEAAFVGEIEVVLDAGMDVEQKVPVLSDEPSPGWADMLSVSV